MESIKSGLIAWASGDRARDAGVQLLIRNGRALSENAPWFVEHSSGTVSVDVGILSSETRGYSSGEIAVIDIACSLLGGQPIDLSEAAARLGHADLRLVLAAVTEAAGFDRTTRGVEIINGEACLVDVPAVYTWEDANAPAEQVSR